MSLSLANPIGGLPSCCVVWGRCFGSCAIYVIVVFFVHSIEKKEHLSSSCFLWRRGGMVYVLHTHNATRPTVFKQEKC